MKLFIFNFITALFKQLDIIFQIVLVKCDNNDLIESLKQNHPAHVAVAYYMFNTVTGHFFKLLTRVFNKWHI